MELIWSLAAVLGFGTLLVVSDASGALAATIEKVIERLTTMQFKIEKLSQAEADETYRRTRSADNVEDYVKLLQSLDVTKVGDTFKLALETVTIEEDGVESEVEILADSIDDDEPDGISVRAAKRRFNAAAKVLGFRLSWKEPTGWLIARAAASEPEVTPAPAAEAAPAPAAPVAAPAPAAPVAAPAPAAPVAAPTNGGNGSRRITRRR